QSQIRKKLGAMDWGYTVDRFDFEDHTPSDKDIDPVAQFQLHTIVDDRQPNLCLQLQPTFAQFMRQASLIGAFKKSRTSCTMHTNGTVNRLPCHLVER